MSLTFWAAFLTTGPQRVEPTGYATRVTAFSGPVPPAWRDHAWLPHGHAQSAWQSQWRQQTTISGLTAQRSRATSNRVLAAVVGDLELGVKGQRVGQGTKPRGAGTGRRPSGDSNDVDLADEATASSAFPLGADDIARNLHERTWASLDLHVVQNRLAELADTVKGKQLARSTDLAEDVEEVHRRYSAVKEVWESPLPIPLKHPMDIESTVRYASRGNVLETPELRDVAKTLSVLDNLKLHLDAQSGMEQLKEYAEGIVLPAELVGLLTDAFDEDGRLSGDKFPALKRLRAEVERLYGSIKDTVSTLLKSQGMSEILTDEYVTERSGRFVIPVKNTFKRRGLGIVHDQSNTGRTVYIEPTEVIEPTNDLKGVELELQQEEAKIMTEMTRLIAVSQKEILRSLEAAALIDVSVARARLGDCMNAIIPEVQTEGLIQTRDARHPVLVLRGREPVGNSVALGGDKPGLILTGPNAGGKTIVLKTLGLLSLLVRLGIPVPVARGGRVDFFSPILADIGDMQSVTGDLSTFSGHLLVCREVLSNAGSGGLVLMDEMGSGTDPAQGVAIAQALLEALLDTGTRVAITTHYLQLKELAQTDPRFTVGAMEFLDGKPTYRFREGAVGESYALEVAERLELPPKVLGRARALMDEGVLKVTELIKQLEQQRDQLQTEIDAAAAREQELRDEATRMQEKMKQLEDKQVELDRLKYRAKLETAETFMAQLEEKEKKLEAMMRSLSKKERAAVEDALQEVKTLRSEVKEEAKPERINVPAGLTLFKKFDILKENELVVVSGDELNVGRAGTVVKVSGQNVDVKFSRGGLDVVVSFKKTELARAPQELIDQIEGSKTGKQNTKWTKSDKRNLKLLGDEMSRDREGPRAVATSTFRTSYNTVDVRGARLRDAESRVDAFMRTGAAIKGRKVVYILHGHGTGQLKEGLREFLRGHPYVSSFKPAPETEGGDAFTQVKLK